jgi:hypothetical protein
MQLLIEQNVRLKRIRRQDSAILAQQNQELTRLRWRSRTDGNEVGNLRGEFRRVSEELEALTEQVNLRHTSLRCL